MAEERPTNKKIRLAGPGGARKKGESGKAVKVRGDAAIGKAEEDVLAYLEKFQRPFNCTQLWENTRKVVSKANVQAALARLVDRGSVAEKRYQNGKVSLYYADPEAMARRKGAPSADKFCDIVLVELPDALVETERLKAEAGRLERRAAALAREPTNAALDETLSAAAAVAMAGPGDARREAELAARLKVLSSRTFVEPADMAAAKATHDAALVHWKTLRRVVRAVADTCAETTEEDIDVIHEAGLFTDREAGVLADPLPLG